MNLDRFVALCAAVLICTSGSSAQITVNPDSLGALGDGMTWDHDAIQTAIDTAGIGGTIELTHGKTYVVCRRVSILQGRTLMGNGATIKRCNSLLTSLTTAASQNDVSIEVEDPENFELGQAISVFTGPTHDDGEAKIFPRILDINGAILTLSQALQNSYPVGAGVIVVDEMMSAAGDDIVIEGVVFDGNRRNNNEWIAWERGSTLISNASNVTFKNNLFVDCWSNCVKSFSTNQLIITGNVFDSVAAAVMHMSTTDSLLFEDNQMVDTNYNLGAGHSEAAITWSALNQNATVRNNCLNNSATGAFGSINRKHNMNVTIEDNAVCDTRSFFEIRLHEPPVAGFEDYGRMTVRNNVGINVGRSSSTNGSGIPPIGNLRFEDNMIVNGYLEFSGLDSASIIDNTILMFDEEMYGDGEIFYSSRAGLITLLKPLNTLVAGNTVVGAEKGMYIYNFDGVAADGLLVEDNVVLDSERSGIITARVNWLAGTTDYRGDNSGIIVDSNTVVTSMLTGAGDAGIRSAREITVANNCVQTNKIGAEVSGTTDSVATGSPTALFSKNTFVGASGALSFLSSSDIADILFDTNTVSSPIPPEFAAATGTLLQGNIVDGSASCSAPPAPIAPACTVCDTGMPELDGVFLDVRVILEGAYAGSGQMTSSAAFQNALGDSVWAHPYGSDQFAGTALEYHGTEFVLPSLPPGVVDWVLVALRTSTGSATEVRRVAGLLMEDGSVRSLDGTPEIFFPGVDKTPHFVVVYHRNHLAVMSSSAVGFSNGHGFWDFTAAGQAFSSDSQPMKDLGGGVFGMLGGDANNDGIINVSDFARWLVATKSGLTGYRIEDFGFDALVTVTDFAIWLVNTKAAAASQVP